MNIHFICRGNVLRSLIADACLKSFNLKGLNVTSSGTNVSRNDPLEKQFFENTIRLLARHNIHQFAKSDSNQLNQSRGDNQDITICMNQRVIEEARNIVTLPSSIMNWDITDIGEGHRLNTNDRENYEEEIFQEIKQKVNELVKDYELL
jgi:protein-tyrosine-phosphatase